MTGLESSGSQSAKVHNANEEIEGWEARNLRAGKTSHNPVLRRRYRTCVVYFADNEDNNDNSGLPDDSSDADSHPPSPGGTPLRQSPSLDRHELESAEAQPEGQEDVLRCAAELRGRARESHTGVPYGDEDDDEHDGMVECENDSEDEELIAHADLPEDCDETSEPGGVYAGPGVESDAEDDEYGAEDFAPL
ncbi:hypothetical protein FKP32DRAFT_1605678 [Trametes sanguinea]|nr:hypothetical protein FKP32DRAFT_1605678 [Trametes sanguinea]